MNVDYSLYVLVNDDLWAVALAATRFYGAMAICPLFNSKTLPTMCKMLICLGLGMIVAPGIIHSIPSNSNGAFKVMLFGKELLIGMGIGCIFSLPIWLIENIGNFIDQQRGEQFGAVVNQLTNDPSSSISKLMLQGFTVYIVAANGLLFLIRIIFKSFIVLPCNQFIWNFSVPSDLVIGLFSSYCYWLVVLALPVIFVMFLLELILGLVSTFVKQLNVTVLSMPIKSLLALFILVFYIGVLYHVALSKFMGTLWATMAKG